MLITQLNLDNAMVLLLLQGNLKIYSEKNNLIFRIILISVFHLWVFKFCDNHLLKLYYIFNIFTYNEINDIN